MALASSVEFPRLQAAILSSLELAELGHLTGAVEIYVRGSATRFFTGGIVNLGALRGVLLQDQSIPRPKVALALALLKLYFSQRGVAVEGMPDFDADVAAALLQQETGTRYRKMSPYVEERLQATKEIPLDEETVVDPVDTAIAMIARSTLSSRSSASLRVVPSSGSSEVRRSSSSISRSSASVSGALSTLSASGALRVVNAAPTPIQRPQKRSKAVYALLGLILLSVSYVGWVLSLGRPKQTPSEVDLTRLSAVIPVVDARVSGSTLMVSLEDDRFGALSDTEQARTGIHLLEMLGRSHVRSVYVMMRRNCYLIRKGDKGVSISPMCDEP